MRRVEKGSAQHSVEDGGKGGDGKEVRYVDVFFEKRGNGGDMTVPSDITLFIYFIYTMWIAQNANRRSRPVARPGHKRSVLSYATRPTVLNARHARI